MKKLSIILTVLFLVAMAPLVLANGEHEEDTSISHQLEELNPLHHFSESHLFAGVMLILFWVSFFYALYAIFQLLRKKTE